MKDRIIKNYITSALGLILIIAAFILVVTEIITWGEFSAFIPTCLGLLWVKDSIFKANTPIILLFLLPLFGSCVTVEKCNSKYGAPQSVTIEKVIQKDSLIHVFDTLTIERLIKGDTVIIKEQGTRASITAYINKKGLNIQANCDTVYIKETIQAQAPYIKPLTKIQKAYNEYKKASAVIVPILLFILFLIIKTGKF